MEENETVTGLSSINELGNKTREGIEQMKTGEKYRGNKVQVGKKWQDLEIEC